MVKFGYDEVELWMGVWWAVALSLSSKRLALSQWKFSAAKEWNLLPPKSQPNRDEWSCFSFILAIDYEMNHPSAWGYYCSIFRPPSVRTPHRPIILFKNIVKTYKYKRGRCYPITPYNRKGCACESCGPVLSGFANCLVTVFLDLTCSV